jgi:hypothetical protein
MLFAKKSDGAARCCLMFCGSVVLWFCESLLFISKVEKTGWCYSPKGLMFCESLLSISGFGEMG